MRASSILLEQKWFGPGAADVALSTLERLAALKKGGAPHLQKWSEQVVSSMIISWCNPSISGGGVP